MDKYRIILTGFLAEGVNENDAANGLSKLLKLDIATVQRLFDGKPHPIKRELEKERAERLQLKLSKIGVMSNLEVIAVKGITIESIEPTFVAPQPSSDEVEEDGFSLVPMDDREKAKIPGTIVCPKCGHQQDDSSKVCESCGIAFAKYNPQKEQNKGTSDSVSDTDDKANEEELLKAFINENDEIYMRKFIPFQRKPGKFSFSWHWPAVFVPFLWAMYRKLWGWAAIIWITSTFLPMMISMQVFEAMAGSMVNGDIPDMGGMWIVQLINIALWLIWPFTVSYIYYRYATSKVAVIRHNYTGNMAFQEAAEQGGTSSMGVVIGVVFNIVAGSILMAAMTTKMAGVGEQMVTEMQQQVETGDGYARQFANQKASAEETATLFGLQAIAMSIKVWSLQMGIESPEQITRDKLETDAGLSNEIWTDSWGHEIRLKTDFDSYSLQSPGPDGVYDNEDDLVLKRKL